MDQFKLSRIPGTNSRTLGLFPALVYMYVTLEKHG